MTDDIVIHNIKSKNKLNWMLTEQAHIQQRSKRNLATLLLTEALKKIEDKEMRERIIKKNQEVTTTVIGLFPYLNNMNTQLT